jgi:hypothetical protein
MTETDWMPPTGWVSHGWMAEIIQKMEAGEDRQVLDLALSEIKWSRQKMVEMKHTLDAQDIALDVLKPVYEALRKQGMLSGIYEYRLMFGALETGIFLRSDDLIRIAEKMGWHNEKKPTE